MRTRFALEWRNRSVSNTKNRSQQENLDRKQVTKKSPRSIKMVWHARSVRREEDLNYLRLKF